MPFMIISGKTHYFCKIYGPFSIAMLVYQRLIPIKSHFQSSFSRGFSYGFPMVQPENCSPFPRASLTRDSQPDLGTRSEIWGSYVGDVFKPTPTKSGTMAIDIVDFPIKSGGLNHSYVTNYQRIEK